MMATARTEQERALPSFPTQLLYDHLKLALLAWAGYVAFALVVILTVAYFRGIEVSGWDRFSEAARWYSVFIGAHVGWSVLPLHVTHGQTRRAFMAEAAMFVPACAAALALMVTITFAGEAGLYRLAGWPQEVQPDQLYGSALELPAIFLQFWLVITLWTAGGLFIGAAWYRRDALGGVALGVAVVVSGIAGMTFSSDWGPFGRAYGYFTGDQAIDGPTAVAIHLALIAVVLAMTWLTVRDVPLRPKKP